jgi:pimeloyl-ACP methyl ester carboxylesterase
MAFDASPRYGPLGSVLLRLGRRWQERLAARDLDTVTSWRPTGRSPARGHSSRAGSTRPTAACTTSTRGPREAGHRTIVPDHLGFGRSDKPDRPDLYAIRRHAERLEALLEALDLRDAVVVAQDWGGPIGLYWAGRHPERVAGLFLLNTFAHRPPEKVRLPLPLRVFRLPVAGEVAVKRLDLFKRVFLFRAGVVHHERLDSTVRTAYRAPHPTWGSRTPILVFPSEIPAGPEGPVSDLLADIEASLMAFADRPVAIMWAMRDIAFTPEVLERLWTRTFPHAQVTRLEDARHYLHEDAHERIVPELLRFLDAL